MALQNCLRGTEIADVRQTRLFFGTSAYREKGRKKERSAEVFIFCTYTRPFLHQSFCFLHLSVFVNSDRSGASMMAASVNISRTLFIFYCFTRCFLCSKPVFIGLYVLCVYTGGVWQDDGVFCIMHVRVRPLCLSFKRIFLMCHATHFMQSHNTYISESLGNYCRLKCGSAIRKVFAEVSSALSLSSKERLTRRVRV